MIASIDFNRPGTAIFDRGGRRRISHGELGQMAESIGILLRGLPRPALAYLFSCNSAGAIAAYLACLREGVPLGLGEPGAESRHRSIAFFRPTAIILPENDALPHGYAAVARLAETGLVFCRLSRDEAYEIEPHPDLALLLQTSGSTADAKYVRLTRENLEANARAIAQYLALGPGDVAVQSLPFFHAYGLSLINSHLVAGGAIALPGHPFVHPEFWSAFDDCGCSSFAGVPYMYETMQRLRIDPVCHPTLRMLTQAGGHLREDVVGAFHRAASARGVDLYVMYGQTEATARMAYVPPERLAGKLGSIGRAIPGGELWLEPVEAESDRQQLFYRGANVMMGYATGPGDLARGNDTGGVLPTGDLACCDSDGYFRITGRLRRTVKVFGRRFDLASIEAEVERRTFSTAALVERNERLTAFVEAPAESARVRSCLSELLQLPPGTIDVVDADRLPLTASGKKDYKLLQNS